jgi:ribose 5-phosphate isomerase
VFTEQGNVLIDVSIDDAARSKLNEITTLSGVVAHGLFPLPTFLLIAKDGAVELREI